MDLARYEAFVTYASGLLTPAVYAAVQQINADLAGREGFADIKAVVTGGKALQFFLGDAPELLTNDVDVKITSGRQGDKDRCDAISGEFSRLAANLCSRYLGDIAIESDLAKYERDGLETYVVLREFPEFRITMHGDDGWTWHRPGVVNNVMLSYINTKDRKQANAPFVDSVYFTDGPTMAHFISDEEFDAGPASIEDLLAYYAVGTYDLEHAYQSTVGRKGFYRQKLLHVDAGDRLYVAALGYVVHDMVMMMNKMYDYAQLAGDVSRDRRVTSALLSGREVRRPSGAPIKLKYQRYLAKYRRVIAALSDARYLNHHAVSEVLKDGMGVVSRPFCAFGEGANTHAELLAEIFSTRLLPDAPSVRAVLEGMNFDVLCDYALQMRSSPSS